VPGRITDAFRRRAGEQADRQVQIRSGQTQVGPLDQGVPERSGGLGPDRVVIGEEPDRFGQQRYSLPKVSQVRLGLTPPGEDGPGLADHRGPPRAVGRELGAGFSEQPDGGVGRLAQARPPARPVRCVRHDEASDRGDVRPLRGPRRHLVQRLEPRLDQVVDVLVVGHRCGPAEVELDEFAPELRGAGRTGGHGRQHSPQLSDGPFDVATGSGGHESLPQRPGQAPAVQPAALGDGFRMAGRGVGEVDRGPEPVHRGV
jgi:hypothetical protein